MKKICLFICMFFITFYSFAQDIIVKIDAEEIQAKVITINEKEISYKKWDNQDGPTYIISIDKVLFIKYANGQKDVFTTTEKNISDLHQMKNKENNIQQLPSCNGMSPIRRNGQKYYYESQILKGDMYANFLKNNCLDAYYSYYSGAQMANAGWALLGCGCIMSTAGIALTASKNVKAPIIVGLIGGIVGVSSIPILSIAYNKMHSSADIFNAQCAKNQYVTYWSINAGSNGIGLAYHF